MMHKKVFHIQIFIWLLLFMSIAAASCSKTSKNQENEAISNNDGAECTAVFDEVIAVFDSVSKIIPSFSFYNFPKPPHPLHRVLWTRARAWSRGGELIEIIEPGPGSSYVLLSDTAYLAGRMTIAELMTSYNFLDLREKPPLPTILFGGNQLKDVEPI